MKLIFKTIILAMLLWLAFSIGFNLGYYQGQVDIMIEEFRQGLRNI